MDGAPLLDRLVEALRCLPGVGPKSAQRMALHVLERDREGALRLAEVLKEAVERIGHCRRCRTLTEHELCRVCADTHRDRHLLCVVETPADQMAIEQATGFRGQYHVLLGQLSPLDGVGPEELGLDRLEARLAEGEIRELILATGTTVEGEVTAHYIADMARALGVRTTRIAHGIPLGGELEYVDRGTLSHAFSGRRDL
ncbi:recombination protein RecR [Ectothiorhodospira sp. PHS-1]|uniref:recombination mediator RecR n=1 Tax=Ectothiorhodospira sp. PHS-1 TaxID=519989 RepID=UPI00024A89F4|nr:recombination mediator RecR [Ectothiorhodospira sp. PHS-1]EHQ53072.1 recombination protein RecR [Ectothiorhodospira sp. PHS-1]